MVLDFQLTRGHPLCEGCVAHIVPLRNGRRIGGCSGVEKEGRGGERALLFTLFSSMMEHCYVVTQFDCLAVQFFSLCSYEIV